MSNSNYSPRRLQDQLDVSGAPSAGTVPVFNALTGRFEFTSAPMPPAPGSDTELLGNVAGAVAGLPGLNYVANALLLGGVDLGATRLNVFAGAAGTPAAVQSNALGSGGTLFALTVGNTPAIAYGGYTSGNATSYIADMVQNNGNGSAVQEILVLGTGDPMVRMAVNGGTAWSAGLDNSDSDAYVVSAASALGTNNALRLDPSTLQATLYGNVHATSANANHDTILESTGASHYSRLWLKTAARNWSMLSWGNFSGDGFAVVDETAGKERLSINSSGYLGLRTINPLQPFVVSNDGAEGLEMGPTGGLGTGGPFLQAYNRGTGAHLDLTQYAKDYHWWSSGIGTEAMNLVNGKLQIGSTVTPLSPLNVIGGRSNVGNYYVSANFARDTSTYRGIALGYDNTSVNNVAAIFAETSGLPSELAFLTYGAGGWQERVRFNDNVNFAASLKFATDNAYDIGASGVNRPRDGYFGRNGEFAGNFAVGGTGDFQSASKSIYLANAAALPAGTPSGGGLLVNDNGTLKWYTPLGNVRTLAAA